MNEATDIKIGDAYLKKTPGGDRIEIIIRRYSGDKWDTIEYNTKWKEIQSAGTSPEHLIVGKKIDLPSSLKKKILVSAKKEMKNPNEFLSDVGGFDAIKFALKEGVVDILQYDLEPGITLYYPRPEKGQERTFMYTDKKLQKVYKRRGSTILFPMKDVVGVSKYPGKGVYKSEKVVGKTTIMENKMKEAKDNMTHAKADDIMAAVEFVRKKGGKMSGQPVVNKKTKSIFLKMYKNGKYTDHTITRQGKEVKENVITKTRLREIIVEEYQKLNEERYSEELAKTLIKDKKVKKGMKEKELIAAIITQTQKDLGKKRANYYVNYDEDFLSDAISAINYYLKRGK
jgi:hypothetical protein